MPTATPSAPRSDEEVEAMIQAVDTDGDGRIDYRGKVFYILLSVVHWPVVTTKGQQLVALHIWG